MQLVVLSMAYEYGAVRRELRQNVLHVEANKAFCNDAGHGSGEGLAAFYLNVTLYAAVKVL